MMKEDYEETQKNDSQSSAKQAEPWSSMLPL